MTQAKRIITLSGSLRKESLNTQLAKSATDYLTTIGVQAQFIDLNDYLLPLFNEDIESNTPEALHQLRDIFSQADGLLIASPEYNGSFSAVLKNTIDWLSRPANDGYQPIFSQITVALVAASPGGLGGLRGLSQLRELMGNLGSLIVPSQLAVGNAYENIDEHGTITNAALQERFHAILESLKKLS